MYEKNSNLIQLIVFTGIIVVGVWFGRERLSLISWDEVKQGQLVSRDLGQGSPETFKNVDEAENFLKKNLECRGCNLKRSELSGLNLTGADLEGAVLQGSDFSSSDLTDANLRGVNLRRADLSSVISLRGADLTGADLTEANVKEKDLEGAILCQTVLPSGQLYEECDEKTPMNQNGGDS